jgi:hypothetical protein
VEEVMNHRVLAVFPACAAVLGSLLVIAPPPTARAQTAASPAQVDALIQDIKAHEQMCGKVDPGQAALSEQCANEHASLLARQKTLGVSDDALNARLKTRGWRWP